MTSRPDDSAVSASDSLPDDATSLMSTAAVPFNADDHRADKLWFVQQRAERKKFIASLPRPIAFLYTLLFDPIFVPGEPFDEYMRKVAVLSYAGMCSSSIFLAIWMCIVAPLDSYGWNSRRFATCFISLQVSGQLCFANYAYVRYTGKCPEWFTNLTLFGADLACFSLMFFLHPIDSDMITLCSLLLASLMSARLFPLHATIHAAIIFLHHIRTHWSANQLPEVLMPWDDDQAPMSEEMMYTFVSFYPPTMASIGLYVIVRGYIQRSKEAQRTNIMAIKIADQLQRYDTKAVGVTIQQNKATVNAKLLDAFDAIRANLDSYRPHIPRYLVDAAIERAEQMEAEEALLLDNTSFSTASKHGTDIEDESEFDEGQLSASHGSIETVSSAPSTHRRYQQAFTASAHDKTGTTGRTTFHGLLTSVYLRITDFQSTHGTTTTSLTALNDAVEEINDIGAATSASIHHIEQGVLLATWNATKRTSNHEIRACSFATKALAVLQAYPEFKDVASAAILTCRATSHFAGVSQMHFVLSHEDLDRHRFLLDLATEHKTIVCATSVVRGAETLFNFVGFAVDNKGLLAYELVEPKNSSQEEEWMYSLNAIDSSSIPYRNITTAAALTLLSEQVLNKKNIPLCTTTTTAGTSSLSSPSPSSLPLVDDVTELISTIPEEILDRSTVQWCIKQIKTKRRNSETT